MTPERATAILRGVVLSIDGWAEECRALTVKCPQVAHLCSTLEQASVSLTQLIERSDTDP
jgi:hypothetical protein